MAARDSKLTAERLRELLDYDPVTGVFTWRVNRGARQIMGTVAGWQGNKGYRHIEIDGFGFLEHRLAWLHVHGAWPDKRLDHKDCVKSNNALENIRQASSAQNTQNMSLPSRSTSGAKGVSARNGKFEARIRVNRRLIWLGAFEYLLDAARAYDRAAVRHFGEFARTNKMMDLP